MKKKSKPLLVLLAEAICGYSDNSEIMAGKIQQLIQEAESFSVNLDDAQVENKKLKSNNSQLQSENTRLKDELSNTKDELVNLRQQNKRLSEDLIQKTKEANRFHIELSALKNNVKTIVDNLIACLQNCEILAPPTFSKEKVMEFFCNQLENVIGIFGISVFEDVDVPVNPSFHKIVAITPSEDGSKVGYISRSLGKGFRAGEKCIVEQQVEVYN